MYPAFRQLLSQIVPFTEKELDMVESQFVFRQVPKKYKLVEEGKIANELYFVLKGLIRLYYTKDGEEITGFIFKENLFGSSYDSFLRQTPSIQTLETLEDSEILVITKEKMEMLYETVPKVNVLTRKVAEQRFINSQMILSSFILDSPEERYRKFEMQNKDLLQRVPQHIIASYLGITHVSLSRIRKRLKDEKS